MIQVYQTRYGKEAGNCMAACVASILECPIEDVDFSVTELWFHHWANMLKAKGWMFMVQRCPLAEHPHLPTTLDGMFVILAGINVKKTCRHAVVAKLWTDVDVECPIKSQTHLTIVHDPMGDDCLDIQAVDQMYFLFKTQDQG